MDSSLITCPFLARPFFLAILTPSASAPTPLPRGEVTSCRTPPKRVLFWSWDSALNGRCGCVRGMGGGGRYLQNPRPQSNRPLWTQRVRVHRPGLEMVQGGRPRGALANGPQVGGPQAGQRQQELNRKPMWLSRGTHGSPVAHPDAAPREALCWESGARHPGLQVCRAPPRCRFAWFQPEGSGA